MFRSAPADIMKTLKEQNVTLNNHIKCIPVEVGTRQTCFMIILYSQTTHVD